MPASVGCSAWMNCQSFSRARDRAAFGNGVADVRAVEARNEAIGLFKLQFADDFFARAFVGRRGQRDARHVGKARREKAELAIFGAEVVAPLRHAMRLVDGEQRDLGVGQHVERAILHEPLRRDVEQLQRAGLDAVLDVQNLLPGQRRIEEGGFDAGFQQRVDLVLHQRDQRATRPRRGRHARARESDSRATCRHRSASVRAHRGRRAAPR